MPGAAAIGGLQKSAAVAVELVVVLPRAFANFPHRRVHNVGIRGINHDIGTAGIFILGNHSLPGFGAIGRAIDSPFFAGSVGMAEDGGKYTVGITGINSERRNLLSIDKAEVSPGFTGVDGFVDAIADG